MASALSPLARPQAPRATTRFSGWRIVVFAAIGLGMTGPGQTVGVSVFVDPMIGALGLTRSEVSIAYLIGTLTGATAMPRLGRLIDDRGTRLAMAVVGGLFGLALAAMSGVTGLITLVVGFTGIRMFGQGALSLVATTSVAPWFARRRGFAIGVTTAVGSALLSLIPVFSEALVLPSFGWRGAWAALGGLVWLVVLPIALRGMIDRPDQVGQQPDGDVPLEAEAAAAADAEAARVSFTRGEAMRAPMFWAVAGAVAATGMIGTGLTATLLVGSMVDWFSARWVLTISMTLLALAMLLVPFVSPGLVAVLYGMVLGAAGSAARALEAASFPKLYGLRHVGAIRGAATSISVASTAFGPLALSIGHDLTGSYVQVLLVLLVFPMGVTVLGLFARIPTRP